MADIREALERALARTERLASDARGPMALDLKFIAEDIRAALADDWRDISTARKDGTWYLLAKPGMKRPWVARWMNVGPRAGERWESLIGALTFEPTICMEIPKPPESA